MMVEYFTKRLYLRGKILNIYFKTFGKYETNGCLAFFFQVIFLDQCKFLSPA